MNTEKPESNHALHRPSHIDTLCWESFRKMLVIPVRLITYKIRQKHPSYHLRAFYVEPTGHKSSFTPALHFSRLFFFLTVHSFIHARSVTCNRWMLFWLYNLSPNSGMRVKHVAKKKRLSSCRNCTPRWDEKRVNVVWNAPHNGSSQRGNPCPWTRLSQSPLCPVKWQSSEFLHCCCNGSVDQRVYTKSEENFCRVWI